MAGIKDVVKPSNVISDLKEDRINDTIASDILQQALQEATESLDASTAVMYDSVENAVAIAHGELGSLIADNEPARISSCVASTLLDECLPIGPEEATSKTQTFSDEDALLAFNNDTTNESETVLSVPPLGSSENPIQIIQQGNTYHSTQLLTEEQLQQIAHVLQQQVVNRASQGGGSTVLYNPATNTRIVYRVIYPSELKRQERRGGRGRGRPRKRVEEEEPKADSPSSACRMSIEERQQKKKHRPRTRYGRISKPPSYMIKDYKRIHHLDFDQEGDNDSDGGYSDYQVSDEDGDQQRMSSLPPGVTTTKARNYRCDTCDRAYIGQGGLTRHYRLHPSHGRNPNREAGGISDENSNASSVSSAGDAQRMSECEKPRGGGGVTTDGRQHNYYYSRRKARLKELIRPFSEEELMEVVLPRLSKFVTLWEFLLMKAEKGDPAEPHLPDIVRHFESLVRHLQRLAKDHLIPSPQTTTQDKNKVYLEIGNEQVTHLLGLTTGLHEVKDLHSFLNGPEIIPNERTHPDTSSLSRRHERRKRHLLPETTPPNEKAAGQMYDDATKDPAISVTADHPSEKVRRVENGDPPQPLALAAAEAGGGGVAFFREKDAHHCVEQEASDFQLVLKNGNNQQAKDSSIIQLVMPADGPPVLGTSLSPQFEMDGFLPSNIVVVQNEDGTTTLQLPSDQSIPMETIQALLAVEQTIDPPDTAVS